MFYVNNKQVLGLFLNGKNYNYMAYGFGKIIPENRNAQFAYINLAGRNLNQYRVEYGNVQSGYNNFPIARLDYPVNGIFHSPLTYYYGGNIVPTKNVPVYINNGYYALRNALVYNDININGNIVYFAANADFKGHNVNIHPEEIHSTSPYFNGTVMNNCSNFRLNAGSRLSKGSSTALYNCNNFSGNFKYVGNQGSKYPGFRGFLYQCRDGIFNIDCTNMHGGGSNIYNFSCISNSNNIKLNITGSPWQEWVHLNCYSGNCNITTRSIVPSFDRMNHCNFNIQLPSTADMEKSRYYSILSKSSNCNVHLNGINSNIYSFRNGVSGSFLFEDLKSCNLNLLLGNSAGLDYGVGNRLNNCNIQFSNISLASAGNWLGCLNNCNVTGSVIKANYLDMSFVAASTNVNINVNASSTNNFELIWGSSKVNGNAILGKRSRIRHSNNLKLDLYYGNIFEAVNVSNVKLTLDNTNNVNINEAYNSNFNLYSAAGTATLRHLNKVNFVDRGRANHTITNLDNCYNSWIYANTLSGTINNAYNTSVELKYNNPNFKTWKVNNCEITGFPTDAKYTTNCTFNASLPVAASRNSRYATWANIWPHATPYGIDGWNTLYRTKAGLESVDNFSSCYLDCKNGSQVNDSTIAFNNNKNMITSLITFYNGRVTVNLPNYSTDIKLNIDCCNLNLGVFQAGPPHGLEHSSISADNIFCNTGVNYYVQINSGTRIYCENFCNVAFSPVSRKFSDNYQPVMLINNYQHSNALAWNFSGGIYRIGRPNFQGGVAPNMYLANGACMFINNVLLSKVEVNNALLFIGSNVSIMQRNVYNGGLIVSRNTYSMSAISKFVNRNNFTWNFTDSGPWGSRSLLNFCIDV